LEPTAATAPEFSCSGSEYWMALNVVRKKQQRKSRTGNFGDGVA